MQRLLNENKKMSSEDLAQVTGGNGGGKPEMAMAGAKDITKIDEALAQAYGIVESMIK